MPNTLADNLRRTRRAQGFTQRELGDASGVCHQQISKYETGFYEPSLENLRALCKALRCSADTLLFGRRRP